MQILEENNGYYDFVTQREIHCETRIATWQGLIFNTKKLVKDN